MIVLRTLSFLLISAAFAASSPATHFKRATNATELEDYEYVIVGSGAGGGPLAARLAINGHKVLLLEAGDDQGTTVQQSIPAFFPAASEYTPMAWDFFVRHYPDDDAMEAANTKATYETATGGTYVGLDPPSGATLKGIWYPRSATLGGCGAHNAMVTVYPHEKDWTLIQTLTGDSSWAPSNMRQYFERIEDNQYLPNVTNSNTTGHGFDGWLGTSEMDLALLAEDPQMLAMIAATNSVLTGAPAENITNVAGLEKIFPVDMNTEVTGRDSTDALYQIPEAISHTVRSSPRDFLIATADAVNADGSKKYDLTIRTDALVTKVRFAQSSNSTNPKAIGVDFLDGQSLYRADARAGSASAGTPGSVNATKEVIISGGTFNTPQLLKLSGIGPKDELAKFNISVVVDLPGVGTNLQDHYEISTVIDYDTTFDLAANCTWLSTGTDSDPCYTEYTNGEGPYATNLIPAAVLRKSSVAETDRDTFIFGGPINFRGYFQGYTDLAIADANHWSWLTLKAHEKNTAGTVTLKSADPQDMPEIDFNFFDAGTTSDDAVNLDLQPLVEGIQFTREIYANLSAPFQGTFVEEYPGANVTTTAQIEDFVKTEAWGHHACGTARIGSDDDSLAVLDSSFRVRGVDGLRVVDASVFPEIPGFFPVVSVYMISEKAADVIMADNA